jgi:hypothetical protein
MTQTNVKHGQIVLSANEDLSGKEGLLVKIVNAAGQPAAALPTDTDDYAFYLLIDGDKQGGYVSVLPLSADRNVRVHLKGTCVPGDVLVLAPITAADAGKVRKLPTATGSYLGLLVAEESGVDGQQIKARPVFIGTIDV